MTNRLGALFFGAILVILFALIVGVLTRYDTFMCHVMLTEQAPS